MIQIFTTIKNFDSFLLRCQYWGDISSGIWYFVKIWRGFRYETPLNLPIIYMTEKKWVGKYTKKANRMS